MKFLMILVTIMLTGCIHLGQSKEEQRCVKYISSGDNFVFNEDEASDICQCVIKSQPNLQKVSECYSEAIKGRTEDTVFMNKFNFVAGCVPELRPFFMDDNQTLVACTCIGDKVFKGADVSDQLLFECQTKALNFLNESEDNGN